MNRNFDQTLTAGVKFEVAVIIEVRMTSRRLPGKHLLSINGEMMISRLIRRVKSISGIDKIILATTTNNSDDVFDTIAKEHSVDIYHGSESDVMGRVLDAALHFNVDVICEVTGDCPIIDVNLTEEAVKVFLANNYDYINNGLTGLPDGLACQVFSTKALKKSYGQVTSKLDKEHVTSNFKRNPQIFSTLYIQTPHYLSWPSLSLSLDERDDFEVLSEVIQSLESTDSLFGTEKVINFFKSRPDLVEKNAKIYRKGFE